MNVQRGLERVSAVWWGFWGLLCVVGIGVAIFTEPGGGKAAVFFGSLAGGVAVYVAHRITCWVVAGFCSPRS